MAAAPTALALSSLDDLPWDHRFTRDLPADPTPDNRRRQVEGAAYSRVTPTPTATVTGTPTDPPPPNEIPEPGTWLLLASGMASGLAYVQALRRRR